ncbi:MAG TPA: hypothetical protein VFL93_10530 [Longimicrobiaceae bacterium]|nr:hypothetical protein [Longimicrobiaceae bacterium]
MRSASANFSFLAEYDPALTRLGDLAELYSVSDPDTALLQLRQFGAILLRRVASSGGVAPGPDDSQIALVDALSGKGVLPGEIAELFRLLVEDGDEVGRGPGGGAGGVVRRLVAARELGTWYHRTCARAGAAPAAAERDGGRPRRDDSRG